MTIPHAFQFWDVPAASNTHGVSFDIVPEEADMVVWKLDLPDTLTAAEKNLEKIEVDLLATREVLDKVPKHIEQLGNQRQKVETGELSFQSVQVPEAEAELFALLDEISSRPSEVSFGIAGIGKPDWQKVAQDFELSLDRLKKILTKFALVETSVQGRLIGRTIVGWSGKVETTWQPGQDGSQFRLHQRSLQAALASRYLMLNLLIVSTQSAAKLSVLLAVPGGALMTLPAVWKFVTRILDEFEKYKYIMDQGVR